MTTYSLRECPYCDGEWHGLPITQQMRNMRSTSTLAPDYRYSADTSGIFCPGSYQTLITPALRVSPDGIADITDLGTPDQHAELFYTALDCQTFDCTALDDGFDMWTDDEFLYNGAEYNHIATTIAHIHGFRQPYHGTVIFTGNNPDGDTTPLPANRRNAILYILDRINYHLTHQ